jgi:hypothetical protein
MSTTDNPARDARPFAELRAALAASTKPPWNVLPHSEGDTVLNVIQGEPTYKGTTTRATWVAEFDGDSLEGEEGENEANAAFVCLARNTLPDVLARLDAAEAEIRRQKELWTDLIAYPDGLDLDPDLVDDLTSLAQRALARVPRPGGPRCLSPWIRRWTTARDSWPCSIARTDDVTSWRTRSPA